MLRNNHGRLELHRASSISVEQKTGRRWIRILLVETRFYVIDGEIMRCYCNLTHWIRWYRSQIATHIRFLHIPCKWWQINRNKLSFRSGLSAVLQKCTKYILCIVYFFLRRVLFIPSPTKSRDKICAEYNDVSNWHCQFNFFRKWSWTTRRPWRPRPWTTRRTPWLRKSVCAN